MKRILFVIGIIVSFWIGGAAQENPVKWKCSVKYLDGNQAELVMKADVGGGYHLYSQFMEEGGPQPTVFHFPATDDFKLKGKISESPKPIEETDEIFGTLVRFFAKDAEFRQKITIETDRDFEISATVDYQVCNDEQCIPFNDVDLTFKVKGVEVCVEKAPVAETPAVEAQPETPEEAVVETQAILVAEATGPEAGQESLMGFFLLAILAGLAAVFTPCVFPMIPMTVSFFMDTDNGSSRVAGIIKGAIFTLSITLIYTLIGGIVAITKSADFANVLSTHWIPNLIFFLLFLLFAFSFFGMFEITLPSGLSNKLDAKADNGGYISAFFMAAVLAIVSFSCTGPFVATLLVEAAMGTSVLKPLLGMFFFGLAMGLPFFILSLFPSLLAKMPKSGGWLNSVKVVFAFVLLAFGMKFILNIDQVYELHLFTREVYLAIWIVIFSLMGFYLLGKIKFSHDSDVPHVGVFRLLLVIVTFTFVVYLIPGLFGAPLKMVSSLVPPLTSQQFSLNQPVAVGAVTVHAADQELCGTPKYADKLHLPFNLQGYFDYEEGLACAKQQNKPVFIDFKGHACANCKKMENDVWSDPRVQALLKKYVIIALYCDDKTELPESEWITSTIDGKVKKTMGKRNADFQVTRFKTNTLPYYHLLDADGNPITEKGYGYAGDVEAFIAYLQNGLDAFGK
ncbi:MAG: thioredoxin family protein [Bacteroidales bacterium]|nr:thioredoxin family protein [Bacteroidales bacterium]MDE7073406.1 thioredoxin family protein [Bacteroidales bacterium]